MAETRGGAVQGEAGRRVRRRLRLPGRGGDGRVAKRILRAAGSRYAALALVAFFFGTTALWLLNALDLIVRNPHGDEPTTLIKGIGSLTPPHEVGDVRVGETNRWFARLLHPAGVLYMELSGHVEGGEADAGADAKDGRAAPWPVYAGHSYLERRFTHPSDMVPDPNIQDYVFFMRLAFGLLAAASFCLLLWALFGRFGFAAAAAYGGLVLGNWLVFDQFRKFYSETTMFILFNLAAALYLRYAGGGVGGNGNGNGGTAGGGGRAAAPPLSLWTAAGFGLFCAAALSTKLSGFIIAALLACTLLVNVRRGRRHDPAPRIEVWLASFLAFLYLINVPFAGSVFEWVNETLHNVYHYASRHRINLNSNFYLPLEDGTGLFELLSSVSGIGPLILLSFPAALLWLALPPRRALIPVYVLGAAVVLAASSFSNQMFYLIRNFASLYVAMCFVVAVAVGDLLERLPGRRLAAACAAPALLLAFLAGGAQLLWQTKPAKEAFFEELRGHGLDRCSSLAVIGLAERDVRTLREIGAGGEVAAFPPPPYEEGGEEAFAKSHEYQCLVVRREGGAGVRQLTNFLAPRYYRVRRRIGELFFFVVSPPPPSDLAATAGAGSIALSWTTPFQPEAGRSRFRLRPVETTYQLRLRAESGGWGEWRDVREYEYEREGRSNRLVLRGLRARVRYYAQLRGRYDGGFEVSGFPAEVSAKPLRRP